MKLRLGLLLLSFLLVPHLLHAAEVSYRVALVTTQPGSRETVEQSAVRRTLQTMGIPFETIAPDALNHQYPLALVPGPLHNHSLSGTQREALYRFVSQGGVLIATQVEGSDWFPLFGIQHATARRDRFQLQFARGVEDGWLRYLDHPKEQLISLGDSRLFKETIWTVGYAAKGARILAAFPDHSAAVVVNDYDGGQALALGVSLTQTVLLAQVAQTFEAGRQWVNSFEPSGDVFFLLLKGIYESSADPAVYWHTVPSGLETAIVLSHDVDARESFPNSVLFAQAAQRFGVRSTFFVTTKTVLDEADIGYYDGSRIPSIVHAHRLGAEIGSHSFSHSKRFATFPFGAATVTAGTYQPIQSPSILGEVKASKELLDRDLPAQHTLSFRAGELSFPLRLIEALQLTGYRYDSTFSANNIITNFPFFAFQRTHLGAVETSIVEIPVTVDDSQGYLTAETKDRVVESWTNIIEANRANAATTCMLIHPTDVTYKLEVFERLLERYTREPVWIGTIGALGEFWSRRAEVKFRLAREEGRLTVHLNQKAGHLGQDLSLVFRHRTRSTEQPRIVDVERQNVPYRMIERAGARVYLLQPDIPAGR
ncbi:MAG TPA: hypothetical protein VJ692_06945 [Nitrospiraceae bacterium]|nr:hypothetical protein [Nitrospiraceae bacterium]